MGATIGVLLSMMSLTEGLHQAYLKAGDPERAIIVSQGADSEPGSTITRDIAPLIVDAPGIAKDSDGRPLAGFGHQCVAAGDPPERLARQHHHARLRPQGVQGASRNPSGGGPHVPAGQA